MDLAGVLERGPQKIATLLDSNDIYIYDILRISEITPKFPKIMMCYGFCRQVRSLVTLLKPQMAQQHQDDPTIRTSMV